MSGFVVWMTGLSGAGKSTLASLLTQELSLKGVHVECLDGDEVRKNLSHGLGFSREDRDRNVRRIGYVARMVARSGSCAITAAISPYRALRDEIRSKTENFLEVYCECPMEVLTERDPKGLYKRALAGEIKNFTGVDDPYEAPEKPDVLVRTDQSSPQECVAQILAVLESKGLIVGPQAAGSMLPAPFGGEVFEAREAREDELAEVAHEVEVDASTAENLMAVANGFFSPVSGFMSEREATKVEKGSALEGGTPWWNKPFVLPLGEGLEPEEGALVRVTALGKTLALTRVDRVWGTGSARRLAGPIEALAPQAHRGSSARGIRNAAREHAWTRISVLFAASAPSSANSASVEAAFALTDGVVIAAHNSVAEAWESVVEAHSERARLVVLPNDFPIKEPRARLVVEKALGASADLLLG